jgi:hypothetical protein
MRLASSGAENKPHPSTNTTELKARPAMIYWLRTIFLSTAMLGITGCQSGVTNIPVSADSETGQAIRRMDYLAAHGGIKPEEESSYRETAIRFIQCAQAGDVQQMLTMTSSQSYAMQSDSIRIVYTEQVVPQFQNVTVSWNPKGVLCTDEQKNSGLMFTGTAHGKKTQSFDVAVYKENGQFVIANIRKHQ